MKNKVLGGVAALAIAGGSLAIGANALSAHDGADTVVDDLVTEGVITQDQADTITERMQTYRDEHPRPGRGGPGGFGFRGDAETEAAVLDLLGIDQATLRERLEAGETLADIAGDNTDELIVLLADAAQQRLDAAVAAGRLTQDEADTKAADIEARVTDAVNGAFEGRGGPRGFGRGGHSGGRHHGGPLGPDTDNGATDDGATEGGLEGSSFVF